MEAKKFTNLTGAENITKSAIDMKQSIKDELKRTEKQRRMTRIAGPELSKDIITQKLALKEALLKANKEREKALASSVSSSVQATV